MIDERKLPPPPYIELAERLQVLEDEFRKWNVYYNGPNVLHDQVNVLLKRVQALEESKEHHFTYHEQQQDIIDNRVKALEDRLKEEKV